MSERPNAAASASGPGASVAHDSAHLHVTGEASYTDDMPELRGTLHGALGLSSAAHARVLSLDLSAVRAAPGVVAVLTARDIPGVNDCGPVIHDDPILADGLVQYVGQPIFLVVAQTVDEARRAARLAQVAYEPLAPILGYDDAIEQGALILPTVTLERGDAARVLAGAAHCLEGRMAIGGQEQFYLEGQVAYAVPLEDGTFRVYSSTQHPSEGQAKVAAALGRSAHEVVIECRRMGGGFGGKESQATLPACAAAVAAHRLRRPVKLRYDRDDDFLITGKRHDFRADYRVAHDEEGRILGLDLTLASRCGFSLDLSKAVNDRAVLHADNAYFLPAVRVVSQRLRTNIQSATAFRGFGGPQGMLAIEVVIDDVARALRRDPLEVRRCNFYAAGDRGVTHYGQTLEDFIIPDLIDELVASSDYVARRNRIRDWNLTSRWVKRGIAISPVKFGIAFTATFMNQGAALVNVYTDGSVRVSHGGTEMGQGLNVKVAQVVADVFQIDLDRVRVAPTDTGTIPNTSPTAASSGTDMNGRAAQQAAVTLRERITTVVAQSSNVAPESVTFRAGRVIAGDRAFTFAEAARLAYMQRVHLSATGFHRTPKIGYDPETLKGRPFHYFAYGASVSEVAIDLLTGETRLLRADVLHDAGRSLNPAIDRGQVEGGFVQGLGWLTSEELVWDDKGRLRTHAPSTYKIPVASDVPAHFDVRLYARGCNHEESVHGSKAVGEPPLMLPISAFLAIRDALSSIDDHEAPIRLDAPATPERVLAEADRLSALRRLARGEAVPRPDQSH
jgi:xanthine dehydrogenase large subunit